MFKSKILDYAVIIILFILLTVSVLLVEVEKTLGFWIAYGFTAVAVLSQIAIINISRGKGHMMLTRFLGMPLIQVSMLYAIAQIITLVVFILKPETPFYTAIIASLIILAISWYLILTARLVEPEEPQVEIDEKGQLKKSFSLDLVHDEIKKAAESSSDKELISKLSELARKVDISSTAKSLYTKKIEEDIVKKTSELSKAQNKLILIEEINELFDKRNEILDRE